MTLVYKVCQNQEWEEANQTGFYLGSKVDEEDGFIELLLHECGKFLERNDAESEAIQSALIKEMIEEHGVLSLCLSILRSDKVDLYCDTMCILQFMAKDALGRERLSEPRGAISLLKDLEDGTIMRWKLYKRYNFDKYVEMYENIMLSCTTDAELNI